MEGEKNMLKSTRRLSSGAMFLFCLAFLLCFSDSVLAWNEPSGIPPGNNVAAPLNTGSDNQTKTGGLNLGIVTTTQLCLGTTCKSSWDGISGGQWTTTTDATGIYYLNKAGVGTSNPLERFQIGTGFAFHDGGNKVMFFGGYWNGVDRALMDGAPSAIRWVPGSVTGAGGLSFETDSQFRLSGATSSLGSKMYIDKNGDVGVGTKSPNARLSIVNDASGNSPISLYSLAKNSVGSYSGYFLANGGYGLYTDKLCVGGVLSSNCTTNLANLTGFWTKDSVTNVIYNNNAANIGITGGIAFSQENNNIPIINTPHYGLGYGNLDLDGGDPMGGGKSMVLSDFYGLSLFTGGAARFSITRYGKIGIGNTDPYEELDIRPNTGGSNAAFLMLSGGQDDYQYSGVDLYDSTPGNTGYLWRITQRKVAAGNTTVDHSFQIHSRAAGAGGGWTIPLTILPYGASNNRSGFMGLNGVIDPVSPLHVQGSVQRGIRITSGDASSRLTLDAGSVYKMWNIDNNNGNFRIFSENYNASGSGGGGAEVMKIDSSGNTMIGGLQSGPTAGAGIGLNITPNDYGNPTGASNQKLLLYNSNNNKYGFGIAPYEMRQFFPAVTGSRLSIGTISIDGNSTFSEKVRITDTGDFNMNGKNALKSNDSWLRLNQDSQFTSGIHTPGFFNAHAISVGDLYTSPGFGNFQVKNNVGAALYCDQNMANCKSITSLGGGSGIGGSGTANYLPKFTAASTLSNSIIYDNGTNVGIGTVSPTAKLYIYQPNINSSSYTSLALTGGNNAFQYDVDAGNQIIFGYSGTTNYASAIKTRHHSGQQQGNAIDFYVWNYGVDGASTIGTKHVMTLDGNANVGIGTKAPVSKLEVSNGTVGLKIMPGQMWNDSAWVADNDYVSLDVEGSKKIGVVDDLVIAGTGNGIVFPDGTKQTTAASTGSGFSPFTWKHYFITQATYTGNLGGQTGADLKCNADVNKLSGRTYKAFLDNNNSFRSSYTATQKTLRPMYFNDLYGTDSVFSNTSAANKVWRRVTGISGSLEWHCTNWTSSSTSCGGNASLSSVGLTEPVYSGNPLSLCGQAWWCSDTNSLLCVEQ